MLTIELRFVTGRYHANPWGRNVNEGEAEWPPSPYRLSRAIIDAWKRRKPEWHESRVMPILEALSTPVRFSLPDALPAHTRSFLPSNEWDPDRRQLVFDAFIALNPESKAYLQFDSELNADSLRDLEDLLREMNYLGRSESWVRAGVADAEPANGWNCLPVQEPGSPGSDDIVSVACVRPPGDYATVTSRPSDLSWLKAQCLTTKDLLDEGWSNPPVLSWVHYMRPRMTLKPKKSAGMKRLIRSAKYAFTTNVLPRVEETVSVAERARSILMGIHRKVCNDDPALVSRSFSGKDSEGRPLTGHSHAFYLPLDEDGDGRLDHMIIFQKEPFSATEITALDRLRAIWQPGGRDEIRLVLLSLSDEFRRTKSTRWVSATPFVTSRHFRKGRGAFGDWLSGEVIRECTYHGLPVPADIEWVASTIQTTRPVRWPQFVRSRKGKALPQGSYGCVLTFDDPCAGPFAIGSGCHFGLGLFVPGI